MPAGVRGNNALLFYPCSTKAKSSRSTSSTPPPAPTEQLVPAAEYMIKEAGASKKFYLLGTDYVFPRTANKVLKAFLNSSGVPEANIAEEYTAFHHQDYQTIVAKIKTFVARWQEASSCRPSTATATFRSTRSSPTRASRPKTCPIMAFSVAEDELRAMDVQPARGSSGGAGTTSSPSTPPENKTFVDGLQGLCREAQACPAVRTA